MQIQIARLFADGKGAPNYPKIHKRQRGNGNQAQLFADDGEDKVGVRFGQKAAFHNGVAQACAEQVALVHGKQRA